MPDLKTTVDALEVDKFDRLAAEWWNPSGKFRPLHKFNPVRLAFIRDLVAREFGRDPRVVRPFAGLSVIDVGCGGGLVAEPLARLGADVLGIDAAPTNVAVARRHAELSGVAVTYRETTAETLAAEGARFDVVLALEIVEHVADVPAFVQACAALVKPGGVTVFATINRTLKAYALAIVGAERVLRWLPVGTHDYARLVKPAELAAAFTSAGLLPREPVGVVYQPLRDAWTVSQDTDVNYMMVASRPEAHSAGA